MNINFAAETTSKKLISFGAKERKCWAPAQHFCLPRATVISVSRSTSSTLYHAAKNPICRVERRALVAQNPVISFLNLATPINGEKMLPPPPRHTSRRLVTIRLKLSSGLMDRRVLFYVWRRRQRARGERAPRVFIFSERTLRARLFFGAACVGIHRKLLSRADLYKTETLFRCPETSTFLALSAVYTNFRQAHGTQTHYTNPSLCLVLARLSLILK